MPHLVEALELPPAALYFNAGVLLMNVRRWRSERVVERAIEFLQKHGDTISWADQDALNVILCGNWGQLDPSWNVQLITVGRYGESRYDNPARLRRQRALLADPGILHYAGPHKPWHWRYAGLADRSFLRAVIDSGWFEGGDGQVWRAGRALSHLACRRARNVKHALAKFRT